MRSTWTWNWVERRSLNEAGQRSSLRCLPPRGRAKRRKRLVAPPARNAPFACRTTRWAMWCECSDVDTFTTSLVWIRGCSTRKWGDSVRARYAGAIHSRRQHRLAAMRRPLSILRVHSVCRTAVSETAPDGSDHMLYFAYRVNITLEYFRVKILRALASESTHR